MSLCQPNRTRFVAVSFLIHFLGTLLAGLIAVGTVGLAAEVSRCPTCRGSSKCHGCNGSGLRGDSCSSCNGTGRTADSNGNRTKSCSSCQGNGKQRCGLCSGRGTCTACRGTGSLIGGQAPGANGAATSGSNSLTQPLAVVNQQYRSLFSPATAFSAQTLANADYLRASGETARNYADAALTRAETVRVEIENSVVALQAYWDRRAIAEAERMKRYVSENQRGRLAKSGQWKRYRDHPDTATAEIVNGKALNMLLERLGSSVLAYNASAHTRSEARQVMRELALRPEAVHQLHVREVLSGGAEFAYRIDEGEPLDVNWWPPALRDPELDIYRRSFERSRKAVLDQPDSKGVNDAKLRDLMKDYDNLVAAFRRVQTREVRLKSMRFHREYQAGQRFLESLAGELFRLRDLGPNALGPASRKFQGDNLIELLTHMSRNGLEFAPAQAGDEAAYFQVFHMMRDLFATIADDDSVVNEKTRAEKIQAANR